MTIQAHGGNKGFQMHSDQEGTSTCFPQRPHGHRQAQGQQVCDQPVTCPASRQEEGLQGQCESQAPDHTEGTVGCRGEPWGKSGMGAEYKRR